MFAAPNVEYLSAMKHTTASRDPAAFSKLQELVRDIDIAMITTVTPDGALRSRPMVTREFTDDGEVWFFTADDSSKAGDLQAEHAVNIAYADGKKHRFVSITGSAEMVHDRERARALWNSSVKPWFPGGLDDPHLALLRVRIETAEFWDTSTNRMVQFFHPTKHASGENVKVDVRATPASG